MLDAASALELGLIDDLGDPDAGKLVSIDPLKVRFVKELALHGSSLSGRERLALARTLGEVYRGDP